MTDNNLAWNFSDLTPEVSNRVIRQGKLEHGDIGPFPQFIDTLYGKIRVVEVKHIFMESGGTALGAAYKLESPKGHWLVKGILYLDPDGHYTLGELAECLNKIIAQCHKAFDSSYAAPVDGQTL